MIPEFPESREVTLEDRPLFDGLFADHPPEISAYTFTNIFAWRNALTTTISTLNGHILVLQDYGDYIASLDPLGEGPIAPLVEEAFRRSSRKLLFKRVSAATALELNSLPIVIEPDRDNWDYLYSAENLITLAGRKYDGKRNMIARAKAGTEYEYVKLDGRTAMECEDFAKNWCDERKCETIEGLRQERCAIYEMLSNFDSLGVVGGAIRVGGEIVAFSLGEALNPETLVIHVEKADSRIYGLYQLVNNEFCKAEATNFIYVNREQDLGIAGLRKAKESYQPVRMIETFRALKP